MSGCCPCSRNSNRADQSGLPYYTVSRERASSLSKGRLSPHESEFDGRRCHKIGESDRGVRPTRHSYRSYALLGVFLLAVFLVEVLLILG